MLVTWTPFNEMARLRSELDRMFNGPYARTPSTRNGASEPVARGPWNPPFDVVEDAERIVLTADLPGVDQQALDIQLEQNVLTVKGERKVARPTEAQGELYRRYERVAGAFARQHRARHGDSFFRCVANHNSNRLMRRDSTVRLLRDISNFCRSHK